MKIQIVKRFFLIMIMIIILIGCDQATKKAARNFLAEASAISFMGDIFRLQYAENKGAFLSLGSRLPESVSRFALIILPLVFLFGLLGYIAAQKQLTKSQLIGFSFILGGGFSNLYDRVFNNGHVIDFMNMGIGNIRTGIFNVADVAIMIGFFVLLLFSGFNFSEKEKAES